jgi:hypothetical protein
MCFFIYFFITIVVTADEKRDELKKRLERFNSSKGNVTEKEDEKKSRFSKSATVGTLAVKRHDPLLDEDSDEEEAVRVSPRRSVSPRSSNSASPRSSSSASPRSSSSRSVQSESYRVGEKCEALYLEDGLWYAAKIKETRSNHTYLVVFTDYGNEQICKLSELKKRKKRSEDKEARLAKIKKQQSDLKNEAKAEADVGESGGRWRGQSALSAPVPELQVNGDSKKSRTRAKAGTLSQMGNDTILGQTVPDSELFAEDAAVVASSRQRAKAHSMVESEEDAGEETASESPSFLTKLFGSNAEEESQPKKGFFSSMFGSSSEEEEPPPPVRKTAPPRKTNGHASGKKADPGGEKSGFFDDLFSSSKGEEYNDGSSDDEVLGFFGK